MGADSHNVAANANANTSITGKCLVMVTDDAERTMNTFLGTILELTSDEIDEANVISSDW